MTQTQSAYSDNGLGSAGITGNIISSEAGEVRIIGRYPERGVPKNGVPFSVDIEIDRYRNFWNSFLLIACPDAVIAALDPQSRKVLAISRILTSMWDGCRGQTRLVFGRSFRPDRNHPVIFELHPSNVTEANISEAKPLAASKVMTLDLDIEEGQQSGVYAPPTEPWYQISLPSPQSAFSGVNSTLTKVLWLVGIGAGAYFLGPLIPGMRDSLKTIANPDTGREEQKNA
ncbi:hypothetical protein NC796_01910 [Aliifodinibius sp. S!AR15-10]|uniref:hypothetical protein n=1 Tax=Aliifodinibius sp. S!AR15-10 TaxID=2950437 RepID=UPI00285C4782|nr:hypothetical protein [Aliifodinibius sp. S!AR15-10]MDR8389874.1 hypothetical protein [Aliifodinibius sp. S!AR15-10]